MASRGLIVKKYGIVCFLILIGFVAAILRMLAIVTFERADWLKEAERLQRQDRVVEPERGNLYAADGSLITATLPYYNLYMDMGLEYYGTAKGKQMYNEKIDSLTVALSNYFGDKSAAEYKDLIQIGLQRGKRRLKINSRLVSYIELMDVKQFPLIREGRYKSGFYYTEFARRENLYGSLASRTLGDIYGESKRGQYGLELYYDSLLAGENGVEKGHLVGRGKWVYVEEKAPVRGVDIYTTLDIEMQDICETAMRRKLERIKAKNACVVLMEVATGEIKAMVNLERASDGSYYEGRNMAVADMSEPGSTFKTLSLMVALDHGVCDTSDIVDLNKGRLMMHGRPMVDHNYEKDGVKDSGYDSLSIAWILAQSSNVGVSRVIDEYYQEEPMKFVDALLATGFAEILDFGVPGTVTPIVPTVNSKAWSKTSLPWMSIGYEVQVPPIYTLNYYNAIANGGKLMRPYLVREIHRGDNVLLRNKPEAINHSICKPSTLGKVKGMLEGVVEYGTAKSIQSEQFAIAGKTGTARVGYENGHWTGKHQVTFCGYFPADKPLYSCIVVVKAPEHNYGAASMCGDVFKKIAEKIYAKEIVYKISDLDHWQGDSCNQYNLPRVKAGAKDMVQEAMDKLGIKYTKSEADWLVTKKGEDEMETEMRPLIDGLVPNVMGMGAADAVYLMENSGLFVQMSGKGRVVYQSIQNGQKVEKGSTVILRLK